MISTPEEEIKSYWESRLKKNWDLSGVAYLGLGPYYNQWLYRVKKSVFFRLVRGLNLNFERSRILDIGSGTGFFLKAWQSLGASQIAGSDIAEVVVTRLKIDFPEIPIFQLDIGGSLQEQKFDYGKFHVISAFSVFFHILDDERFLNAFLNVSYLLEQNGILIFSDNFLHGKSKRNFYQASRSLIEIRNAVEEAGLEIMGRWPLNYLMSYPIDASETILPLLWKIFMRPTYMYHPLGYVQGAFLYPLEMLLVRVLKESPTMEVMICRKK